MSTKESQCDFSYLLFVGSYIYIFTIILFHLLKKKYLYIPVTQITCRKYTLKYSPSYFPIDFHLSNHLLLSLDDALHISHPSQEILLLVPQLELQISYSLPGQSIICIYNRKICTQLKSEHADFQK